MPDRRRSAPEFSEGEAAVLKACFEGDQRARCIVDADATIIIANPAAHAILKAPCGLVIRDGRLSALEPDDQQQLQATLAARRRRPNAVIIQGGDKSTVCYIEPVNGGAIWSILIWRPHERSRRLAVAAIEKRYALTRAQARVVAELVSGGSVKAIASRLGIGIETVRTHLRAIYGKMDVNSQPGVVATFYRFFAM